MLMARAMIVLGIVVTVQLAHSKDLTRFSGRDFTDESLQALSVGLSQYIDLESFREIRIRKALNAQRSESDHVLVYLFAKNIHRFEIARASVNAAGQVVSLERDYRLSDFEQAELASRLSTPHCPDSSVQFIAFAPNRDTVEQQVTADVADTDEAAGLKTVRLLLTNATKSNYLNYMSCPRLVGNFYDGDSNPDSFITVDGEITAKTMSSTMAGVFRSRVTNIWLACEAFNDPMLSAIIDGAQSQKYAAGKNDLLVGPSDRTAACAMKAAIQGYAMTAAFNSCYSQFDDPADQWGFDGHGSDFFGQ